MFFKNKLKIAILVENGVCDTGLKGEWGFPCLWNIVELKFYGTLEELEFF